MLCLPPLKAKKLEPMLMICGLVTAAGAAFGFPFVGITVYSFVGDIEEGQDDEKKKYLLVGILGFIGTWVGSILTAGIAYVIGALISIIMGLGMLLASMNDEYKAAYSTGDAGDDAAAEAPAAEAAADAEA
jgi:hypothetical protein